MGWPQVLLPSCSLALLLVDVQVQEITWELQAQVQVREWVWEVLVQVLVQVRWAPVQVVLVLHLESAES